VSRIIQPFTKPEKRITITIDNKGNARVEGIDLRRTAKVPGKPEMPVSLMAAEIFFWLSKIATDGWLSALQQINGGAPAQGSTEGGTNETEIKTD